MSRPKSKFGPYVHRKNHDGTFDAICTECFLTVASASRELELQEGEKDHRCSEYRYANVPAFDFGKAKG